MNDQSRSAGRLPPAAEALRLHQWPKNVLVLVAPLGAHRIFEPEMLRRSALAFAAFSLVASALYVVNDMNDREADRRHPRKRLRAIARGALRPAAAWPQVPVLLGGGFGVGAFLPRPFLLLLAGYAAGSFLYTIVLKRAVVADVLALAGLYTVRVYAGGLATEITISAWLATFSMFAFLSLALLKRASELLDTGEPLVGRGYRPSDQEPIVAMGTAASYVAVLVLAFYVASPEVRILYSRPAWLWALCPLVLYSLSRLWILARRGAVTEDPVIFTLKDPTSWLVGAVAAAIVWLGA